MNSAEHDQAAPNVIAIAASAGGIPAICQLLGGLSPRLAAAILVVQHLDPRGPSVLTEILARKSALPVSLARDGDKIQNGHVYVAQQNRHMTVTASQHVKLTDAPPVHYVRPSADALFESLPAANFAKTICVVLTGSGFDGAAGAVSIKKAGGVVIAQDRESADFFGMPGASIKTGSVDLILSLEQIPAVLSEMVGEQ